jgi:phosphoribosyl-ATP pyrophosphohydrolase/phosphoribosyl-AMP cyclohydrolase
MWSALAATIAARNTQLKEHSTIDADSASREESRSYTRKLLLDRNLRLKKIGEECAELIAACADGDANRSAEEAADLIYHVAVALEAIGSSLDSVADVLLERSIASSASA